VVAVRNTKNAAADDLSLLCFGNPGAVHFKVWAMLVDKTKITDGFMKKNPGNFYNFIIREVLDRHREEIENTKSIFGNIPNNKTTQSYSDTRPEKHTIR
jgi:uncharacterized protein YejL (UPF0352 family)